MHENYQSKQSMGVRKMDVVWIFSLMILRHTIILLQSIDPITLTYRSRITVTDCWCAIDVATLWMKEEKYCCFGHWKFPVDEKKMQLIPDTNLRWFIWPPQIRWIDGIYRSNDDRVQSLGQVSVTICVTEKWGFTYICHFADRRWTTSWNYFDTTDQVEVIIAS